MRLFTQPVYIAALCSSTPQELSTRDMWLNMEEPDELSALLNFYVFWIFICYIAKIKENSREIFYHYIAVLSPRDMWVKMEESVEVIHILHSSALLILITGDLTFIAYILLIFWMKCDSAHTVSFTVSCYLLTQLFSSLIQTTLLHTCIFQPQIACCV